MSVVVIGLDSVAGSQQLINNVVKMVYEDISMLEVLGTKDQSRLTLGVLPELEERYLNIAAQIYHCVRSSLPPSFPLSHIMVTDVQTYPLKLIVTMSDETHPHIVNSPPTVYQNGYRLQ